MAIKVNLQRISEMDSNIDYPSSSWFAAVPRVGEMIQVRNAENSLLSPRMVVGVNYLENEPNDFHVLVVIE